MDDTGEVMAMRAFAVIIAIFFLTLSLVHAEDVGLGLAQYGYITPSEVTTYIEATIENRGFYRVFVALPKGWELDMNEYNVKSYSVREYGLWRIYGDDKNSMLARGKVYTTKGLTPKSPVTIKTSEGTYTGWYIKPNEGLEIKVKTEPISGEGIVDPLKIEKLYPGIVVLKWYEEFELKLPSGNLGWVRAPWVVRGATLTEAYPAPYGEASRTITKGKSFVGAEGPEDEYLEVNVDVPRWDEWLPLRNPLAYALISKPLAKTKLEFMEVEPLDYVRPVWDIQKHRTGEIRYAYEWKRDREIRGITFFRDDTKNIPSWMELF